ncbi:SNF2-related protein [Ideonella sp. DXS22W]|uniref:SNF2-related protein n=1 Tax=Pseudaquabacterium inlustre TaxID=2984192 RepID=A0ABU9CJ97_9BURK
MATTPAQKRTPRRRAGAATTDAADTPALSPAAAAPAAPDTPATTDAPAKPARKKATKAAATAAAKPAVKSARKAAAAPAAEASPAPAPAPAVTEAVAPAAEAAAPEKAPKKTAPKKAAPKKTAASKTAAKKAAPAKKAAAKKAPARKTAQAAAADEGKVMADEVTADAADAATAATAPADAAPAPARKRSPRKAAASAPAAAAPVADAEPVAAAEAAPAVVAELVSAPATEAAAAPSTEAAQAAIDEQEHTEAIATDESDADATADVDTDTDTDTDSDAEAEAPATTDAAAPRERGRRNRRRGRDRHRDRGERAEPAAEASAAEPDDGAVPATVPDTESATSAEPAAPIDVATETLAEAPAPAPAPAAPARPPRPAPSGPAHSTLRCVDGDQRQIVWQTGHGASDALFYAALERLGADGRLGDDDDDSLPRLLRQAGDEGHRVEVDPAVWAQLAARRDARTRAGVLLAAYPDGPASPALRQLLTAPLPLFQAEGALWAVVAGRGLLADERGLGKSVQAIAAAQLWRRHFGLRRVAVISGASERLAWQRAWRRFAGLDAQVMEGGLHQRQAAWSQAAEVRILAPEALASDAAHLAHWTPELVIVDEPQRLALDAEAWAVLDQAPQALVLCGAPLDDQPALLAQLVAWLDRDRLGALAALREVQAAREGRATLGEADVERVSDALSRSVLQRQRAEVAEQLPALVYSERLVPLAPAQREAHDRALATLRRGLAGWQASGYLSDTDQWRLATTLRAALAACHRADPAVETSPLADAVVQAVADQLQAWAPGAEAAAPLAVAVLCETEADAAQLDAALQARGLARDGIALLAPGQAPSVAPEAVLQVGVPWRTRRAALLPAGARTEAVAGQQWLLLVAQDSLETALFDTLAARLDAPRSAAEPGSRGFLQGERLLAWLQAVQLALQAMPAAVPSVSTSG